MIIRRLCHLISLLLFTVIGVLAAHEGHHHHEEAVGWYVSYLNWAGHLHLMLNHFPIALIIMTAVSELLHFYYQQPMYEYAARFMICAAALFALPVILFGWALAYEVQYTEPLATYLVWHQYLGIATAILTMAVAWLKVNHWQKCYRYALAVLVCCLCVTSYIGCQMTFG